MSFFEIPKGVLKKLYYFRYRFYWQVMRAKENSILPNGISYASPKIKGALGSMILMLRTSLF